MFVIPTPYVRFPPAWIPLLESRVKFLDDWIAPLEGKEGIARLHALWGLDPQPFPGTVTESYRDLAEAAWGKSVFSRDASQQTDISPPSKAIEKSLLKEKKDASHQIHVLKLRSAPVQASREDGQSEHFKNELLEERRLREEYESEALEFEQLAVNEKRERMTLQSVVNEQKSELEKITRKASMLETQVVKNKTTLEGKMEKLRDDIRKRDEQLNLKDKAHQEEINALKEKIDTLKANVTLSKVDLALKEQEVKGLQGRIAKIKTLANEDIIENNNKRGPPEKEVRESQAKRMKLEVGVEEKDREALGN